MHELSIATGVVDICEQHAAGRRVLAVSLTIGALSGVVPEALEFCFEAATKGTLLDGARLEIERVAASGCCPACKEVSVIESFIDSCPRCGGFPLELKSGEELRVKDLEVE